MLFNTSAVFLMLNINLLDHNTFIAYGKIIGENWLDWDWSHGKIDVQTLDEGRTQVESSQ